MKFSIATACAAILLAQSASAWTFTWREADGTPHIHDGGKNNQGCAGISHGSGQVFEWDRGRGSKCCISLYTNNNCEGDPQGYSCPDWTKAASRALYSYQVTHC